MNEKSGFRRGMIRMEYVIIAVLIAVAIILAMWFFGRDVMNMFGVTGQATTGDCSRACETQSMQEERSGHAAAERANKFFVDSQKREAVETSVRAAEVDVPLPDDDRGRERNAVK